MNKKIVIIIVVLVFSLIGIIIGRLSISDIKIQNKNDWNVYFANLQTSIINGEAFVPVLPEIESTSIKAYDVLISKPGDFATYTFDVINDGDIDAKLENFTKIEPKCISLALPENFDDEKIVCNNLEYSITYTKNGNEVKLSDILKAKSKENLTLKIGYKESSLEIPKDDVQITLFDMTLVYNHSK